MSSCGHTTSDNGLTSIEIEFGRGRNVNYKSDDKNNEYKSIVKRILREHLESYYRGKKGKKKDELCEQVYQKINEKLAKQQKILKVEDKKVFIQKRIKDRFRNIKKEVKNNKKRVMQNEEDENTKI